MTGRLFSCVTSVSNVHNCQPGHEKQYYNHILSRMNVAAVRLVFVFVAFLATLHLTTSLKLLRSNWLKDDPQYRSLSSSRIEPRAALVADLLNDFPGLKVLKWHIISSVVEALTGIEK